MIGYCGYRCHLCPARSEDPKVRQKLVDGWRKLFGHESYTAESVKCSGCKGSGSIADKTCKARPCAKAKGVEFCADCGDFPCANLRPLINSIFFATEEEYEMRAKQFDIKNDLLEMLKKRGKGMPWLENKKKGK